jgi:hypothetical protein
MSHPSSHRDIYQFLPQLLAVLIDRAGGTIELSDSDVERVANMGPVELEYFQQNMFTGSFVKIRYNERVNIQGETVNNPVQRPLPEGVHDNFTYDCMICGGTITVIQSTRQPHECRVSETAKRFYANETVSIRDMVVIAPDFTGGLSVDEYMDEQRGRGQE